MTTVSPEVVTKWVQVREAHIWPSVRDCQTLGVQPKQYFHVCGGDGYTHGSTVALSTLLALGLRVEVVR